MIDCERCTASVKMEDADDLGCEGGSGCFLDPCDGNDDCDSGWCVEHMGDGVCSVVCQEECPNGWECRPVGAAEDACLDYGIEGSFCGGLCSPDGGGATW